MPEDLDKTLKPQELVDLLTFLAVDRSPEDPDAKWLAGFRRTGRTCAEKSQRLIRFARSNRQGALPCDQCHAHLSSQVCFVRWTE